MNKVHRKHRPDSPTSLGEMILDPFGLRAKEQSQERSLREAEQLRLDAEVEKAQARIDVREANERTAQAQAALDRAQAEMEKTKKQRQENSADAEMRAEVAEGSLSKSK